jgi:hypothetical protein
MELQPLVGNRCENELKELFGGRGIAFSKFLATKCRTYNNLADFRTVD